MYKSRTCMVFNKVASFPAPPPSIHLFHTLFALSPAETTSSIYYSPRYDYYSCVCIYWCDTMHTIVIVVIINMYSFPPYCQSTTATPAASFKAFYTNTEHGMSLPITVLIFFPVTINRAGRQCATSSQRIFLTRVHIIREFFPMI